jgi:hypothetical protein
MSHSTVRERYRMRALRVGGGAGERAAFTGLASLQLRRVLLCMAAATRSSLSSTARAEHEAVEFLIQGGGGQLEQLRLHPRTAEWRDCLAETGGDGAGKRVRLPLLHVVVRWTRYYRAQPARGCLWPLGALWRRPHSQSAAAAWECVMLHDRGASAALLPPPSVRGVEASKAVAEALAGAALWSGTSHGRWLASNVAGW